jgi:putative redox protein
LKEKAVQKAIELSQEKYCSVAATLKAKAEVSFDYEIQQV